MSRKPKVLLSIGYTTLLLPDDTNITAVMKALSQGVICDDQSYQGKILLRDRPLELGMKYVPAHVKYKDERGEDLPTQPAKKERTVKALPSSERNLLEYRP
jgi:hypothetical protein